MGEPTHFTRRLPTLREHLGDDIRGGGFAEWADRHLAIQSSHLPEPEKQFMRIMNTFVIACVEQMSRESDIDPSPEGIGAALSMWARAAGYTTIMAVASVSGEDAPLRRLARILAEEFKVGAKLAADAVAEDRP